MPSPVPHLEKPPLSHRVSIVGSFCTLLGDPQQGMRVANNDTLPPAFREGRLIPLAHDAADREQRRTGHLGDILSCQRKGNLNTTLNLLAGLADEPQENMGDAPLSALRGNLHQLFLLVLQACAKCSHHIAGDRGVRGDELAPIVLVPGQGNAVDDGRGGRWVVAATDGGSNAEYVAGIDVADDHLGTYRRRLGYLQMAIQEHEEMLSTSALLEQCHVLGKTAGPRMREDVIEIVCPKTLKKCDLRQKDAVKRWGQRTSPSSDNAQRHLS